MLQRLYSSSFRETLASSGGVASSGGPAPTVGVEPTRVAIVGGGIAGLALAQLLRNQNSSFEITVYERDKNHTAREQGYYLNIDRSNSSLTPLLSTLPGLARLLDDTNSLKHFNMLDRNGNLMLQMNAPGQRCVVDRCAFRECLAQNVSVEYNKRFASYEETDDAVIVYFDDGSKIEADFLIGADGARSMIRKQRCPIVTYDDVGVTTTAGILDKSLAPQRFQSLLVGDMSRVAGADGHTMLMFEYNKVPGVSAGRKQADGEVLVTWMMSWPGQHKEWQRLVYSEEVSDDYGRSKDDLLQELKDLLISKARKSFVDFPAVEEIIQQTDINSLWGPRQLHSSNPSVLNENALGDKPSRVVLIGDSIHPMTPNAGNGANTALIDAANLSQALQRIENGADWKKEIVDFNKAMVLRAQVAVKGSLRNTYILHSTGWKAFVRDWVVWGLSYGLSAYRTITGRQLK